MMIKSYISQSVDNLSGIILYFHSYSDYIVRELRITKTPTNSDGQPIVENNGIAKRNGGNKYEFIYF